jgi:hypothetical protein
LILSQQFDSGTGSLKCANVETESPFECTHLEIASSDSAFQKVSLSTFSISPTDVKKFPLRAENDLLIVDYDSLKISYSIRNGQIFLLLFADILMKTEIPLLFPVSFDQLW